MVFRGRCLEINPNEGGYISSSCTHADVAYLRRIETSPMCGEYWFSDPILETGWAEEIMKIY